jgi:DNA repair exonuclease SbcCD ATPase subunit
VISDAFQRERLSRESQLEKLTLCEDDLSQVATNVTELIAELHRLRTESEALGRALADREALLEQQRSALAKHEVERSRLHQQAGVASEALRAAETQRFEHDSRVAALERELDTLRTGIDERDRRLVELNAQHELVRGTLAEHEDELKQARADAEEAARELAEVRRDEASDEPPSPIGHVRLIALPDGYTISESEDPCPRTGDVVHVGFGECAVMRIGPSPFPGDKRRCAVLSVART